jgi:hypothetical protein
VLYLLHILAEYVATVEHHVRPPHGVLLADLIGWPERINDLEQRPSQPLHSDARISAEVLAASPEEGMSAEIDVIVEMGQDLPDLGDTILGYFHWREAIISCRHAVANLSQLL